MVIKDCERILFFSMGSFFLERMFSRELWLSIKKARKNGPELLDCCWIGLELHFAPNPQFAGIFGVVVCCVGGVFDACSVGFIELFSR